MKYAYCFLSQSDEEVDVIYVAAASCKKYCMVKQLAWLGPKVKNITASTSKAKFYQWLRAGLFLGQALMLV